MIKNISLLIVMLFSTISMNAQSLAGIWNTGVDNTKIEIIENNGVFSGKVLSSDNAKAKIGKQIIKDVKLSNGVYKGQLYAAKKEEWYNAILKNKGKQLYLTIKVGWMSKNISWKKE